MFGSINNYLRNSNLKVGKSEDRRKTRRLVIVCMFTEALLSPLLTDNTI